MDIKWAFLCQTVKHRHGLTDILGIGDQVSVVGPPWASTVPVLLVMGLEIQPSELGETKDIEVELREINTGEAYARVGVQYQVEASITHWARHPYAFTIHFTGMDFPHPGEFDLVLYVDGTIKNSVAVRAINIEEWEHEAIEGTQRDGPMGE